MSDFTEAQLLALKAAKASGTLTVEYNGRRVTYRSLAEIDSIIRDIEREVRPARPTVGLARFSKGF